MGCAEIARFFERDFMTPFASLREISREGDFSSLSFSDYFNLFPGKKTIQTFDDKGENKRLIKIIHFDRLTETMSRHLWNMNADGAGIFLCINETDGKGRCVGNVKRARAVYADLDGAPLEPTLEYHPSLIVESSPGRYHPYWFTTDTPLNGFTALQKTIIRLFKSDPAVHDLPRVLRVPGFYHQKGEKFLSRVCGGSGEVFKHRDLISLFPPEKVPQWSAKRYRLDKKSMNMTEFHGKYGAMAGERNWNTFRRVCGMIKAKRSWQYIEKEARLEGSSCMPPLEEKEIQKILKSASRYLGV
jgi:hypothetical protein